MDFIKGLPPSNGKNNIMVVVDQLSKYACFFTIIHPYTASKIAHLFMESIFKLHGISNSIVSDRDKVFTSGFWKKLFRLQGIELCMSSSYHLQSDGQTEVVNRYLKTYLRCFTSQQPKQWTKWFHGLCGGTRLLFHNSIGMSPYEVVYDQLPPTVLSYI